MTMAKTIQDIAKEVLAATESETISVYDRYAGIVDGANAVLREIENACMNGVTAKEKYSNVLNKIKQLKGE